MTKTKFDGDSAWNVSTFCDLVETDHIWIQEEDDEYSKAIGSDRTND